MKKFIVLTYWIENYNTMYGMAERSGYDNFWSYGGGGV